MMLAIAGLIGMMVAGVAAAMNFDTGTSEDDGEDMPPPEEDFIAEGEDDGSDGLGMLLDTSGDSADAFGAVDQQNLADTQTGTETGVQSGADIPSDTTQILDINTEVENQIIAGQDIDEIIDGGDGDDQMNGYEGDDTLDGGAGDDVVFGAEGDDVLFGGDDDDSLHGEDGEDTLAGNDGADSLFGHMGDDHLDGNDGDDSLVGGFGDDVLDGGTGNDALHGGADDDRLTGGGGADTLFGGEGDDLVDGRDGDSQTDFLNGGDGNDVIAAGAGDYASGGEGLDTFLMSQWQDDPDPITITDYNDTEDSLVLMYEDNGTDPDVEVRADIDNPDASDIFVDGFRVATVWGGADLETTDITLMPQGSAGSVELLRL